MLSVYFNIHIYDTLHSLISLWMCSDNTQKGDYMRRNIYVSDPRVEAALCNSDNASRLIQDALLYYLWSQENGFVTHQQVIEIMARYFNEHCIHTKEV